MDFSTIREVGSAFLIGVTVLAAIEATLYIGVGWSPTGLLSELIPNPQTTGTGAHRSKEVSGGRLAVYVACATVLGLLTEMAFQPLMNDAMGPLRVLPDFVHGVCEYVFGVGARCPEGARSRQDLRLRAMYSIDRGKGRLGPARLLDELIADHQLDGCYARIEGAKAASSSGKAVKITMADAPSAARQASWNSGGQADNAPDTEHPYRECLLELFYTAENWDYMHPELYEELKNIEARIDFASALWLVSISLLPWAVMFVLCGFAIRTWKARKAVTLGGATLAKRAMARLKRGTYLTTACGLGLAGMVIMGWMDGALFGGAQPVVVLSYVLAVLGFVVALGLLMTVAQVKEKSGVSLGSSIVLSVCLFCALIGLHLLGYYSYAGETKAYAMRAYGYFATAKDNDIVGAVAHIAQNGQNAPRIGMGKIHEGASK